MKVTASSQGDHVRYRRHPTAPAIEMIEARYVRHRFARHTHDAYTVALIEDGVEEWSVYGSAATGRGRHGVHRAGRDAFALVNPDTVHTGHAAIPDGWAYRVLRPDLELMTQIAVDLGMGAGPPQLTDRAVHDPATAAAVRAAFGAAEHGDQLAASTLLRTALVALLTRHATRPASEEAEHGNVPISPAIAAARDLLHADLVRPPSLEALAAAVQVRPFTLLRTFARAYGLPPHAYLTQLRVHTARRLLAGGERPADVARITGFADQAHLSRHFKRIVGMPPGVFQRGCAT